MTRRIEIQLLAAGIGAFVAACFLAHPIGVTIVDEVNYFTEAFALWRGWPLGHASSYLLANGAVPFLGPRYPGGWPLVVAPFTALPWPWPFIANPAIHVLGAGTMALVLRRRGLSPAWALLYLAQPTLLTFSRTLMAEPLAGLQTALLLLCADFENPLLLGLVAGFAPLIKLSQVIVAGPFVAVWLWRRRSLSAAMEAGLGSTLGLAGFLWFNHNAYGHWLAAEGLPDLRDTTPRDLVPRAGPGPAPGRLAPAAARSPAQSHGGSGRDRLRLRLPRSVRLPLPRSEHARDARDRRPPPFVRDHPPATGLRDPACVVQQILPVGRADCACCCLHRRTVSDPLVRLGSPPPARGSARSPRSRISGRGASPATARAP